MRALGETNGLSMRAARTVTPKAQMLIPFAPASQVTESVKVAMHQRSTGRRLPPSLWPS